MGRHFSKVGATVILGPLKQKSQGARPPGPPGSDAYAINNNKYTL